jgi:hypothetical protein
MPLFVNKDEVLHHIGSAFLISPAGLIATASHCIAEALRVHGFAPDEFRPGEEYDLLQTKVKLSVLHVHSADARANFSIWSVANMQVAHPTDVAFGCLHDVDAPAARAVPALTFEVPGPDTWLHAIGYPANNLPPLELRAARDKTFDWRAYQPTLVAATGQVKAVILHGYTPITRGPCVVTDCPTLRGMSGGPVITGAGVCGVVSGSTHLEDGADGSVLSLLYPTLSIPLDLVLHPAPNFAFRTRISLFAAAERGLVKSDGSHRRHRIVEDDGKFRVDPLIDAAHLPRVFDTRRDFVEARPSRPLAPEPPPPE